jgi:hypothetical protein
LRQDFQVENVIERGYTLEPKVTLNSWRYVSTELGYGFTTTNYRLAGLDLGSDLTVEGRSKMRIRRFTYNALFHLRPNGKRFRPYAAVGPAFQLMHLLDSKPRSNSVLKFAARDLALFVSAYNFSSKPPLEGGGIFQVGLNYGAGMHFHITPKYFLRADFRETLSVQPDFWTKSHRTVIDSSTDEAKLEPGPYQKHGPLRHQLVTLGLGIAF